jgi:hypothetical protein
LQPACKRSTQGCTCRGISNKLIALSEGRPEGNWIPLTDPRYKFAQGYSPLLQDLMAKLLDPNPATRITAANALQHPWVRGQVCGPSSPSPIPLSLTAEAGETRARSDSFLEEEPTRLKKAPRTHMRRFEREAFAGVSSRSSGAAACAAAVEKIKKLRMTAGGSEGDVDVLADPEHQLVDFILSDDAETCRLALISLTTQMASLLDACNFIKRLHVLQNLQQVFINFYKKVSGKMPKLLELLEVLVDHRDTRILEELLLRKELVDFIILNADSSRPSRTFLKAQRIIVRCVQTADVACDRQTVSRVLHAFRCACSLGVFVAASRLRAALTLVCFSPNRLSCTFVSGFFCTRSNADLPPTSSRRCAVFSGDDANAAKARALGFEPGRPYYIVNGTSSKLEDAHDYRFQVTFVIPLFSRMCLSVCSWLLSLSARASRPRKSARTSWTSSCTCMLQTRSQTNRSSALPSASSPNCLTRPINSNPISSSSTTTKTSSSGCLSRCSKLPQAAVFSKTLSGATACRRC